MKSVLLQRNAKNQLVLRHTICVWGRVLFSLILKSVGPVKQKIKLTWPYQGYVAVTGRNRTLLLSIFHGGGGGELQAIVRNSAYKGDKRLKCSM